MSKSRTMFNVDKCHLCPPSQKSFKIPLEIGRFIIQRNIEVYDYFAHPCLIRMGGRGISIVSSRGRAR